MQNKELIQELFDAGSHIGYSRTRRHPSAKSFIVENRGRKDIINLETTVGQLEKAFEFLKTLHGTDGQVLFVGTKPEARRLVREAAELIEMPFVTERWVGGTLTNNKELRRRVDHLVDLQTKAEKGELVFQTKKEKLMIEREIERLEKKFGGLKTLRRLPKALFIIDPRKEHIAVTEALQMNIPIIAIANTDCNISILNYPIVANDTNISSISLFTKKISNSLK